MTIDRIPTARDVLSNRIPVPDGVKIQSLTTLEDSRGSLTEMFREEWGLGPRPLQWNVVRSEANVLRGVHAHRTHVDYLAMIMGEMVLCLHDLRPASPTYRLSRAASSAGSRPASGRCAGRRRAWVLLSPTGLPGIFGQRLFRRRRRVRLPLERVRTGSGVALPRPCSLGSGPRGRILRRDDLRARIVEPWRRALD